MPRVTRQSAAHEASLSTAAASNTGAQDAVNSSSTSNPSATSTTTTKPPATKQTSRAKKATTTPKVPKAPVANIGKKRKGTTKLKVEENFDVNELPHGLGRIIDDTEVDEHNLQSAIESPPAKDDDWNNIVAAEDAETVKELAGKGVAAAPAAIEEASSTGTKTEINEVDKPKADADGTTNKKPKAKRSKADPNKPKRVKKVNKYGVTLGVTPYPDWPAPTPEQAHEVNRILGEVHGEVRAPKAIPLPSLTVAGCGEVPNILEALMRTLLSAHTTNKNAGTAIQGMIKKYGTLKDGLSKGNVNWNAVRLSSREEVEEAIKHGGLAKSKSKDIWKIVEMVYEENKAMREELAINGVKDTDETKVDANSSPEDLKAKSAAVFLADPKVLTLDYMHIMPAEEAFSKFITFPGIGVKTASCTLLFCMQRPSFAVDTHVYRLCQYLGWVPMGATRDTTFAHCDVRIPDELKYSLHQLLIAHGKTCGRCRAITGESSEGWDKGCKLEHLVKRYGAKKGGEDKSPKKAGAKGNAKKKKVKTEDGEEDESKDTDSLGDDEGEYSPVKKAKALAKATKPKAASKGKKVKKEETTDEDAVKDEPNPPQSSIGRKKAKAPAKAPKKKATAPKITTKKRKNAEAGISNDHAENDNEAATAEAISPKDHHQPEETPEAAVTSVPGATGASDDADEVVVMRDAEAGDDDAVGEVGSTNDLPEAPDTITEEVTAAAAEDAVGATEPSGSVKRRGGKAAAAAAPRKTVEKKRAAPKAKAPPRKRARKA